MVKRLIYTLYIYIAIACQYLPAATIRLESKRLSSKDGMACNTVYYVSQDADGYIWLSSPYGTSRYDGYSFINFSHFDSTKKSNQTAKKRNFQSYYDKQGNLWLTGKNGWKRKFHLMDNQAYINARDRNFSVAEDSQGNVYIASYGNGLFVYCPKDDSLSHFSAFDKNPLFHTNFLLSVFVDNSDGIWITTGEGLYCAREIKDADYKYVKLEPKDQQEWSNSVRHISHIGNGKLVVSTRNNKTYTYDTNTQETQMSLQTEACVYAYAIDAKGRKWIGTKGGGLLVDGVKYSRHSKEHYVPTSAFYDILFDKHHRAWLATWGYGLLMANSMADKDKIDFKAFLCNNKEEAHIHDLLMDKNGRLWIATNNGIAMIDTRRKDIRKQDFHRFNEANGCLPANEIVCCLESKDGTLWFGTTKGILRCNYNEQGHLLKAQLFNKANGLMSNIVRSIAEDRYGNIWVGTEEGMSKVNPKNLDMRSVTLGSSIQDNNFTENCALSLADGRMVFGVSDGMLILKPHHDQTTHRQERNATITDVTINGVSIYGDKYELLQNDSLSYMQELRLPADKNSLCIYFSNFYYPDIQSTSYQYYLEGVDKAWLPMSSLNHADYRDLSPGRYTFHLRTLLADNRWSKETKLGIFISQPWYNTWWAWMAYIVIVGGMGLMIYRFWRRNFDLNQQMALEKQMTEFRIDFFTHISHEFRTPLSIILNAVEKLTTPEGTSNKRILLTLSRGTKRLQRLIDQLMEFRKANTGNLQLSLQEGDLVGFVRNIYNDLYSVARQKNLNMTFTPWTNTYQAFFDHNKIETIIYNLLSNAVKYTPAKGTITARLLLSEDHVCLSVEDSGPGISPECEKGLFKPFMHGYASQGGMGIGLYVAHQMATIHKGTLRYQRSEKLGGSMFTLEIPSREDIYRKADFARKAAKATTDEQKSDMEALVKEMTPKAINDISIAIIEDDADMMEQIKGELSPYFNVYGYMNGREGYEEVSRHKPALLICDIMLPDMSGYEIVSNLKANPETQGISIIMLTAFDDTNHILKAYKNFVDDYMVKPYNAKLLIARVLQYVTVGTRNGKTATTQDKAELPSTILASTLDKKFKDKVEAIVAQHLSDKNFNVDRLAELLNVGRTTVYSRMKAVMGTSPNMYIQNERLRIAANLLLQDKYSVAEISEKVGFSDSTYFYKCFKNKYGVAPSKYGK